MCKPAMYVEHAKQKNRGEGGMCYKNFKTYQV
uniref:Uncharacterized protein n=1 Tax=Rhizophora mucronata TaxID=61149 RepID=A0A2P2PMF2_RHIMU